MTDKLPERVRREVERIRSMQNEHGDVLARQYLADEIVKLRASCLASENNGGWRKEVIGDLGSAQTLCCIYFEIAAAIIGEDEVRRRRDILIESLTEHREEKLK